MTFTLDVRGDATFVLWNGTPDAIVQPDTYSPGSGRWTSWRRTGNPFDANSGWEFEQYHDSRDEALRACGWREGDQR